jgi:hypothetical protein
MHPSCDIEQHTSELVLIGLRSSYTDDAYSTRAAL